MSTVSHNEYLLDAMIKAAVCQVAQAEIDAIDWNPSDPHVFSAVHERKMKTVLRRHRRRTWLSRALPVAKRVVVIALVILAVAFGGLMTVEAVRSEVVRVFTQWFDKFTNVGFVGGEAGLSGQDIDLREAGMMLPEYVPEGYELVELVQLSKAVSATYKNREGATISYEQFIHERDDTISTDNERHNATEIYVGDAQGLIALSNQSEVTSAILIWRDGFYTFMISGELDEAAILAIAQSLQPAAGK